MYAQSGILKVEKEHFKLKTQCHVNSNEEGDRFVGIKAESDKAMVYFPIGYELPDSDAEIRRDIKHLMQVLAEFTTKEERLLAVNKFTAAQKVEFPINAYRSVIEYFLSTGKYYVETEATYVTATSGKQEWQRTIKKHLPFVQKKHNMHSLVYSSFVVRTSTPNFDKQITQINKYCVFEAFQKIGWIYSTFMPEKPGTCPSITEAIVVVREKLSGTNDDKKRKLFKSMLDMLNYLDEKTSELQFYFGTEDFDHVWEKLIDKAFGERNKDKYFPRSRWHLDYGKYKEKRPLSDRFFF